MDETYVKVKGGWMYLCRAVDIEGNTIDFLLSKKRNKYAAHKFLLKKVINIDQSGASKDVRQCKSLNNRVEADHRFIKWRTQQMLGF
jgi:putative transposase